MYMVKVEKMFPMKRYLLFAFCVLLLAGLQAQNTVFVSASASNDNGDGTTWETAKKTIAAGITAAGGNGTVFVKAGNYATTAELTIPAGVTVMGGYQQSSAGTDTSLRRLPGINSNWGNTSWCTIISGAGNHRIATVNGTLDGCVARYGFTNTMGGGLLIDGGTARYCVLIWNDAIHDDDGTAEGGGAYVKNNGMLLNSVVTECRGDNGAGVSGEDGSLINNTITRNWPSQCGTVTDYDGNTYHTVQIGSQCWMKENLRTTHYSDGTAIATSSSTSNSVPYWNYPNNNAGNVVTYGLLYNWPAVMHGVATSNANPSGVQGPCPEGWHVPSDNEWTQLTNFVSSRNAWWCSGNSTYIAKALASRTGWNTYSGTCYVGNGLNNNNATRFGAVPAGSRNYNGNYYDFGNYACFWSATENNSNYAWYRNLYYGSASVNRSNIDTRCAYSVRCLKDPE